MRSCRRGSAWFAYWATRSTNTLAPIKSIAGLALGARPRRPRPPRPKVILTPWADDHRRTIRRRSIVSCRRMPARAPSRPAACAAGRVGRVRRGARSRRACRWRSRAGPPVTIHADGDQLDHAAISSETPMTRRSRRRAAFAFAGRGNTPHCRWSSKTTGQASRRARLFVLFFTTKPRGSGIGLDVLCRQIAEAHGGSLSFRFDRHGGNAWLRAHAR